MEDGRRVRGSQVPEGTVIALLVGSEKQCGREGCDSWRTIGMDVEFAERTELGEEEFSTVRYIICLPHLADFIDRMFFKSVGIVFDNDEEGCDDPDCPDCYGDSDD